MGTSKSFSETSQSMVPNWKQLSSSMTRNCDASTLPTAKLQNIMKNFVEAIGGSAIGGRGRSKVAGRSSIKTAKKIGDFFQPFQDLETLETH
jgi:hypothetical protein